MSNKTDLAKMLKEINSIAENEVRKPDMPIDNYLQEAEDLNETAQADKEKLMARGLKAKVLNDFPIATGACRETETIWFNQRYEKDEAKKEWDEKSPLAFELRDDLIDEFEYAFAKEPAKLARVAEIKDGTGNADMIQDLNNLSGFGKKNLPLLKAKHFDESLLERAAVTSDTIAQVLARVNGDKGESNEAKVLRDKAYTYLKKHVDEIRRCGKFLFRKDKEHVLKYQSKYYREH